MELQELKEILFGILVEVDDCFRRNNIHYFLDSGTALGAVREHDFIEWDDDVDLCVFDEDLDRIRDAIEGSDSHLHFWCPEMLTTDFCNYTVRIYDDRYTWYDGKTPLTGDFAPFNYISVDLFCMTEAPENKIARKLVKYRFLWYNAQCIAHRKKRDDDLIPFTKMSPVMRLASKIIGKPFKLANILKARRRYIEKNRGKEGTYYTKHNYTPLHIEAEFRREWYTSSVPMLFHGREFPVCQGYDAELTYMYGDYMTPGQKGRIVHLRENS
ncbi:MAG: LicD family protein [Saccharofermentans sp.]|nr:LicD family protein [Saccharofermentans sp.]